MNINYKHKKTALSTLIAMSIVLILTISAIPFATDDAEAQSIGPTGGPWLDPGSDEALKYWMTVIPVVSEIYGAYNYFTRDSDWRVSAGDDDEIKAFARNLDSQLSVEQQYNLLMLASNLVDIDTQTWKLTDAYLNRAAEIAAGYVWYEGASFDANEILEFSGIYESMSNGNLSTQDVLDQAVSISADLRDKWDATNYGSSLNIEMIWNGGSTGTALSTIHSDFLTLATVSNQKNVVYLSQSVGDNASPTNSTLWAYTTAGTITPLAEGSSPTTLLKGANDVSDLPSGFYRLTPGTYGGPLMSSVGENVAPVMGAMGIICDDQYGYAVKSEINSDNLKIFWNGTTVESNTLDFKITGCDTPRTSEGSPAALVHSYAAYYDQLTSLLFEAAASSQVMWTISATAHSSNILLSPSSLIPHLKNVNVDPQQSYAMYVLALDQISQYNATYGGVLKDGMMKISAQSLDLYCQGSIYAANGTPVAENVIFTPYIYLKDWTIYSGTNNTFSQSGMIMIWDTANTTVGWDVSSTTDYQNIVVEKGTYFLPNEIIYQGAEVPSVHLDVEEIQRISAFEGLDWDSVDAPNVLSAATLIMIIVLELGVIIALIGYVTKMPTILIIGLVVALIGILASEWIARIVLESL